MAVDPLAQFSAKSADRIREPMDRISEVLFGLIMALTFTLTLGVVTADTIQVRTMLLGALGCNLAWGIIDASVFLMARFNQRGRSAMQLRAMRAAAHISDAHRIIAEALPPCWRRPCGRTSWNSSGKDSSICPRPRGRD